MTSTIQFKQRKPHARNKSLFNTIKTLGLGDLKQAIELPEGEDLNEWLACNLTNFFNQLSTLYATLSEYCTPERCPKMSAGSNITYLWSENEKSPPIAVSAPEYVRRLLEWVEKQLDDQRLFPEEIGVPFPKNFLTIVKNIFRRLFRIYAHCYYHHLDDLKLFGTEIHLNTSFKHFVLFTNKFNLIPADQLQPLQKVIDQILH